MGVAYGQVFGKKHSNQQQVFVKKTPIERFLESDAYRSFAKNPDGSVAHRCCQWTREELDLLNDETIPYEDIAAVTGRSYNAVMNYASQHGFPTPPERFKRSETRRRWTRDELAMVADETVSLAEIMEKTGRTKRSIIQMFHTLGLSTIGR